MKTYLSALALIALVHVCARAQLPVDAARVDQIVAADMMVKHRPAVEVAIAQNGHIVYSKAFGKVDLDSRTVQ